MNTNIAVLLSGGVDSSLVVHLLCEQGYKPSLFYIKIGNSTDGYDCPAEEDIEMCRFIARKYGLKLDIVDLHRQYWDKVVTYLVEKCAAGLTPNPDVMCNKLIKFGCFEEEAGQFFDKTATGHYATIREWDNKIWLGTAKDPIKDQTDFLSQISYSQLIKLMFPIGNLNKDEVRQLALAVNLPSAKRRDSQGICFLGKINYNDLLRQYLGEKKGIIVERETGKIVGTHSGYWFHTIGQRKGLGLSGGPWYVIDKDIDQNIVYVSNIPTSEHLYGDHFCLKGLHFITDDPGFSSTPTKITFKIRHTPEFLHGEITQIEDNKYLLHSDEAIWGIAPGQFGVIYDEQAQRCIGSAEISL